MPAPVTYNFFCNSASFPGTTFGRLTNSSSHASPTLTTWGWEVGANAPPLYAEMNWNQEITRLSPQWQASPTQSAPHQSAGGSGAGNCWVTGSFNGEFLPGPWIVSMSVSAISNASAHTGRFLYRFWRSISGSGFNSSLITSSFFSSSIATINATNAAVQTTASFIMPGFNMRNEFLLIQTYWDVVTAGGNSGADNDFVLGTASVFKPTGFVEHRSGVMIMSVGDTD